jgi:hypothetical protein
MRSTFYSTRTRLMTVPRSDFKLFLGVCLGYKKQFCLFFLLHGLSFGVQARSLCEKPTSEESFSQTNEWTVYESISSLRLDSQTLYESHRRLEKRAYWNGEQYQFSKSELFLPQEIIQAISSHITQALALSYAEGIFYPDMGHVHVLVPETVNGELKDLFFRKDLLFLYHTAELLKMKESFQLGSPLVDDPWLQWRYFARNFVGTLDNTQPITLMQSKDHYYNTVRSIEGYREIRTLHMSASNSGCFMFNRRGATEYFDIASGI